MVSTLSGVKRYFSWVKSFWRTWPKLARFCKIWYHRYDTWVSLPEFHPIICMFISASLVTKFVLLIYIPTILVTLATREITIYYCVTRPLVLIILGETQNFNENWYSCHSNFLLCKSECGMLWFIAIFLVAMASSQYLF